MTDKLIKGHFHKNPAIHKILFVGPNGNIGKMMIPELLGLGYQVRALANKTKVEERDGMEVIYGGTADMDVVKEAMDGVDAVIHMIRATTATSPGATDQEKWFNCCVCGTANLLDVAKDMELVQFIAGSMDGVYGIGKVEFGAPIKEDQPLHALDFYYGIYKIVEEELYRQYMHAYGLPITITRFPLIWQLADAATGRGLVSNEVIKRKIDKDGKPLVDHMVFLPDAVQGVMLALQNEKAIGETFNIPGPKAHSSQEYTDVLKAKFEYEVEDVERFANGWEIDYSKAASLLGYQPHYDLLELIKGTYGL